MAQVLIIGSGAAGLSCAIRLAEYGHAVTVICKDQLESGSTLWAQGGISAVLGGDDSLEEHIQDTCIAGAGLCDEQAVRYTVEHGAGVIHWLLQRGVAFTRDEASTEVHRLHLTREGGHSHRRIAHAADATGRAVETTLAELAQAHPLITIRDQTSAMDLDIHTSQSRVQGIYLLDTKNQRKLYLPASAIVLATGGANQVYPNLSNPKGSPGDGIAMAWRAGCRVANMEFMQFHPTGLYHPGGQSFLISEALRGEGGLLKLPDGNRFMDRFDTRQELAPRDIVARAIDHEMKRLHIDHVLLDITHKGPDFIHQHFPSIHAHCLSAGIDITREPIPVVPIAHFTCGGIVVNTKAQTDITGLYAIGEVSYTGLHGANRMASNSLLECLVYARAAANDLHHQWSQLPPVSSQPSSTPLPRHTPAADTIKSYETTLRHLMGQHVGIVRTTRGLEQAKRQLQELETKVNDLWQEATPDLALLELHNLMTVSKLIIQSAIRRKESRGLHYTRDYPQTRDNSHPTYLQPPHSSHAGQYGAA